MEANMCSTREEAHVTETERVAAELRIRFPDPEERWIAAHRILKGEEKTHEDYMAMRTFHEERLRLMALPPGMEE